MSSKTKNYWSCHFPFSRNSRVETSLAHQLSNVFFHLYTRLVLSVSSASHELWRSLGSWTRTVGEVSTSVQCSAGESSSEIRRKPPQPLFWIIAVFHRNLLTTNRIGPCWRLTHHRYRQLHQQQHCQGAICATKSDSKFPCGGLKIQGAESPFMHSNVVVAVASSYSSRTPYSATWPEEPKSIEIAELHKHT